jgi:hypothetical protein
MGALRPFLAIHEAVDVNALTCPTTPAWHVSIAAAALGSAMALGACFDLHPDVTPGDSGVDATGACPPLGTGCDSSQSSDVKDDDAVDVGVGLCNLSNSAVCRGQCPGNDTPCGCLPDPATQATYCGVSGTGGQGSPCSSDKDCAPGYGCLMTTGICAHWCRIGATACPTSTTCQPTPAVTLGAVYHYCY